MQFYSKSGGGLLTTTKSGKTGADDCYKPLLFGLVNQIDGPEVIGNIDGPIGLLSCRKLLLEAIIADEHLVLVLGQSASRRNEKTGSLLFEFIEVSL